MTTNEIEAGRILQQDGIPVVVRNTSPLHCVRSMGHVLAQE